MHKKPVYWFMRVKGLRAHTTLLKKILRIELEKFIIQLKVMNHATKVTTGNANAHGSTDC